MAGVTLFVNKFSSPEQAAGHSQVGANADMLDTEGRHVVESLTKFTNEAENILDAEKGTTKQAKRYYQAIKDEKWWAFFMRGQAIQAETEEILQRAARTDPVLGRVTIRPNWGVVPDFVFTQNSGVDLVVDITSPRNYTMGKVAKYSSYSSKAKRILAEIYHGGRGLRKK